jgi:hypothetical protein
MSKLQAQTDEIRKERDESRIRHEETKVILMSTRDNLEELRIEHESTSYKLDKLTTNMSNISINTLNSNQYSLPPIKLNKREVLIITGVKCSKPNVDGVGMFYIVNRTQICNFKKSRKQMLRRIFNQVPYSELIKVYDDINKPDSYLVPIFYTTTPNPVNLWTTFRIKYESLFRVEIGIIKFLTSEYKMKDLIFDLDGVEKFVKEMGGKKEDMEKLVVKKKDLVEEGTKVVVLEPLR